MIIQNQIKCNKCDDVIYSAHRHDYVSCKCGNCAVDGGIEYLRRTGSDYTDMSMSMPDAALEECIMALRWAKETGRNEMGAALAIIRALRKFDMLDMTKFNFDE